MAVPKIDIENLKVTARKFDYIRFTWIDLYGIPKGKTVSGCYIDRFLEHGVGVFLGTLSMGPCNEISTMPLFSAAGYHNIYCRPVVDEVSELPWCNDDEDGTRVGEIICEPFWTKDKVLEANPRFVARKQIDKLASMGLKIFSAYEMEFMVVEKESLKPLFSGNEFTNVFTYSKYSKMFEKMNKHLKTSGVDIETFQCEYSPGQFEFTFDPKFGIIAPDMMFKFKEAMKEMCHQRGYECTFMTRPFVSHGCSNGTHFNFSLWNEKGENVFYDKAKPNNFSDIALYFIGGLLKHSKALTAICSPTANCYRRLHNPWAPDFIDWDIDNRNVAFRGKNLSENGTYFENRISSGSSNPYLVQAATIAAGIDGIKKKIEPKKMGYGEGKEMLPHTFEEAIDALKADECMKEALGHEFVEWFIYGRNEVDIAKFGKHNIKSAIPEEIEAERLEYFTFM